MHLPDADVVAPLVAPPRGVLGPAAQRRPERHVLHGERRDHRVVRLHGGGADDVGVGVEQARREPDRLQVQVVVEDLERLVPRLGVEVHEAHLAVPVLGRHLHVAELLVARERVRGRGLGDHHGALEAGGEEVEDPVEGVGVARGERLDERDHVRLHDHVLLLPQDGQDLVLDEGERLGHVLSADVPAHERDDARRHRLRAQPAGRRHRGAGRPGRQPQEPPTRHPESHLTPYGLYSP